MGKIGKKPAEDSLLRMSGTLKVPSLVDWVGKHENLLKDVNFNDEQRKRIEKIIKDFGGTHDRNKKSK